MNCLRTFTIVGGVALTAALATSVTPTAATLVESGHNLILIADSANPIDPSQAMLGLNFGGMTGIESITVDDATGLVYVQVATSSGACPSTDTAIYEINPVTGVTVAINPSTGFGICSRGSDIDIDPGTGLLLAQDELFGPGGRIATVSIPGGGIGTWVAPSVFSFNSFGMGFSQGIGLVPLGDVVYVADEGGNINSAAFGGPNVLQAIPPGGGDDLYIQPDGDIVFVGDFSVGIQIYNPMTFMATPSVLPPVDQLFFNAGLNFGCGTRATVCPSTGEGFITWSCAPGGDGIFRLDEPVANASLLLTMAFDEGIQDITIGPSSGGPGFSLYMTVENYTTGAHQVWEVTNACEPPQPDLDIKPGSCPNAFNPKSRGKLPVALVGTDAFDVMQVDFSSLRISRADGVGGSVAPIEGPPGPHTKFDDVATPFLGDLCGCHELGGDGIFDVMMHFRTPGLVSTLMLSGMAGGTELELVVSGTLFDGTTFQASDCITFVPIAQTPMTGRAVR